MNKDVAENMTFAQAWQLRVEEHRENLKQRKKHREREYPWRWNLFSADDYKQWFPYGTGLPEEPTRAGEFAVETEGDIALTGIYPSGIYSHLLSAKHTARLTSPNWKLEGESELWLRVIGQRGATTRYVVQNYPRNGTVYPVRNINPQWQWHKYDLAYWSGDDIHIELTTARDAPLLVKKDPKSWFGVREAVLFKKGTNKPPAEPREYLDPVFDAAVVSPPQSFDDLASLYVKVLSTALQAWKDDNITDAQALFLGACLEQEILPNHLEDLEHAKKLLQRYRELEAEITIPTRVPGLEETVAHNQPLYLRGNHKLPGQEVPRRFLEAIDPTSYETTQSGRRQLAEDLLREDNPLTRRVIINRIWHHLFGSGIVSSPDNFGRLGDLPTHPELLDYLATRFAENGWSIKDSIRFILTSQTWQMSSRASVKAREIDPDNRWLSHANVRRLEAEAIRDSLLAVSGVLQKNMYGAPVDGNTPRRSVYVRVKRN